ncbi:UNVERIFIED_CONTAM: hypothetical protein Sangu_1168100, partial [Sesamum angustifolium]
RRSRHHPDWATAMTPSPTQGGRWQCHPPLSPRRQGGNIALDLGGRRPDPAGAMSPLMIGFSATEVGHLRCPIFFSVGTRRRRRRR